MKGFLHGLLSALPLGLALSIACVGARPMLKRGGMLSLSLALYFAFGAYAAGWAWNKIVPPGSTGSLHQILAGFLVAVLGAACLALPNLFALRWRLRGHFYGLFSLAYAFGLWSAIVNLQIFTKDFDGFQIRAVWPRPTAIVLVTVLLLLTLAVVYKIEWGWRGTSLDWIRHNVHDQAIYGINELRLLTSMELVAAGATGLAGACYAILLNNTQRGWGEPGYLVLIVLATLLSASHPWMAVVSSTALAVIRPMISLWYAPADLVVLGLALFLVSAHRRW
ncbi:MAG TPA: hypothetical protein VF179_16980 [Thermoanaerobaculia bacterium]|nr:hypothetical protein [Thermoanaerobaculia bacterium]